MVDDPEDAGTPRTQGETRVYENDSIRVFWDASRCIHTAICLNMLPSVFDVKARPWVDIDGAPAEEISATVRACPTGALRYEPVSGGAPEQPQEPTVIDVRPNGPLIIRGRVQITRPGSREAKEEYRVALCRCGASENKPFCDNSHRLVGFRDS